MIGSVLEVEDIDTVGFRGFIRLRIDIDATKPFPLGFFTPCPILGRRKIRLQYEGLRDFCTRCGWLGHFRGCPRSPNSRMEAEGWRYDDGLRALTTSKKSSFLFLPRKKQISAGGINRSQWCHWLEKVGGGLYINFGEMDGQLNRGKDKEPASGSEGDADLSKMVAVSHSATMFPGTDEFATPKR